MGWLGIAQLLLKAFQGYSAGKAAQAHANAEKEAEQRAFDAQKSNWDARQGHHATGVDLARGYLSALQPSLGNNAPNYNIDPAIAAKMKEAVPFSGSLPTDPTRGTTWQMISGLAGAGAEGVQQIGLGKALGSAGGSSAVGANGAVQSAGGTTDITPANDPNTSIIVGPKSSDMNSGVYSAEEDRARICALAPNLTGCKPVGAR